MEATKLSFWVTDGAEDEREIEVPAVQEVCHRCNGRGVTDPPSFNGFTGDDFNEDPEFMYEYMQGVYDIVCTVCNGTCVLLQPDRSALSEEELTWVELWEEQEYLVQDVQTRDVPYLDLP